MSLTIQFKLTAAGSAAAWAANASGLDLPLTHVQAGIGNRTPTGTETALVNPAQTVAIASGTLVSDTQIRMAALFSGSASYIVREVGVWSGNPADSGAVLVYYWSQASGSLLEKPSGIDWVFANDMTIGDMPVGTLTITADTGQSSMLAMMAEHEADPNAHLIYATRVGVQQQSYTAITTSGTAPAYTGTVSPGLITYVENQRVRLKFHAGTTSAPTLNINGLGAKNIKTVDGTGSKIVPAFIPAGWHVDVEYDGTDFVLSVPPPAPPLPLVVVLNTPGSHTVTVPNSYSIADVELYGAGSGGARGAAVTHGEGGSGGGYSRKILSVKPNDTLSFSIGGGGATFVASTSGIGPSGGDTVLTYGSLTVTAHGASGAVMVNDTGGAPGAGGGASGGDINCTGQKGFDGGDPSGGIPGFLFSRGGHSGGPMGAGGLCSYESQPGQWPGGGGAAGPYGLGVGADGGAIILFR